MSLSSAPPPHEPRGPAAPWVAGWLGLLGLLFIASALSFWPYTVDDALITLRYARNLVEGHGPVYTPGEWVEGYSNPLWMCGEALILKVGLPPVLTIKVLGLLCGLLAVPAVFTLGRRLGLGAGFALLAPAVVATSASVALWSVAGLETTSFMLLIVLAVDRFEAERRVGPARPWSAALWILVYVSRPEAPAYLLYPAVRRLAALAREPWARRDTVWLAVMALGALAFEGFGWFCYGHLLPQTHGAKLGAGVPLLAAIENGGLDQFLLWRFAFDQGPLFGIFAVASALAVAVAIARRRMPVAAWAPCAAGLIFVVYAFSDWMPRYRLLVPVLPFLALAAAVGWREVASLVPHGGKLAAGLVALSAFGQWSAPYAPAQFLAFSSDPRGFWPAAIPERLSSPWHPGRQEPDAWYVLEEVPDGEWVATPDIGIIGELTNNPIWDIRGLVTPEAARLMVSEAPEEGPDPLVEALLAKRVALIIAPRRKKGFSPFIRTFIDRLRADPRVTEQYEELRGVLPRRVVWRRRGLEPKGVEERVRGALKRLPSMGTESALGWRERLAES